MIHLFNTLFCKKTKGVTFACHEDTLCIVVCGGPRPTDERGGGGACQKFSTLWASVWYKLKLGRGGEGGAGAPLDRPLDVLGKFGAEVIT